MSLYNMLFGSNEEAPILLGMLSVNKEFFGRFRDIELINNGSIIRVFTRLGGGNRKDYKEEIEEENWKIKSILTHEQYGQNCYRLEK